MVFEEIDAYRKKAAEDLQRLDVDLSRRRAEGRADEADAELDTLRTHRREFNDRIWGMGLAKEDRWQDLKGDLDHSWERVKPDLRCLTSKRCSADPGRC